MRKKEGFNIRKVCGENILVAEGMSNIDFSDIISMNETAAYLWNSIGYEEFTVQTLADLLVKEYEIDEATAFEDAKDTAGMWGKVNIIEGDDVPEYGKKIREPYEELKNATDRNGGDYDSEGTAPKGLINKIKDIF